MAPPLCWKNSRDLQENFKKWAPLYAPSQKIPAKPTWSDLATYLRAGHALPYLHGSRLFTLKDMTEDQVIDWFTKNDQRLTGAQAIKNQFTGSKVSDEAIRLIGFESDGERDWFRLLLGVQGVGTRVALGVLGTLAGVLQMASAIAQAVARQMAQRGDLLVLVGRGAERVSAFAQADVAHRGAALDPDGSVFAADAEWRLGRAAVGCLPRQQPDAHALPGRSLSAAGNQRLYQPIQRAYEGGVPRRDRERPGPRPPRRPGQ